MKHLPVLTEPVVKGCGGWGIDWLPDAKVMGSIHAITYTIKSSISPFTVKLRKKWELKPKTASGCDRKRVKGKKQRYVEARYLEHFTQTEGISKRRARRN